jgi:cobalt-zinc-cadmium efflux system membrane fusion protein
MRLVALFIFAGLAVAFAFGAWTFRDTRTVQHWTSLFAELAEPVLAATGLKETTAVTDRAPKSRDAHAGVSPSVQEPHEHSNGTEHGHSEQAAKPPDKNGELNKTEEHDDHGESVQLDPDQMQEFGIEVAVANQGPIAMHLERPAEVKFSGDRLVHVVPRVGGVITQVIVSQGQTVKEGAVMAVLNSRELAELKAAYLADVERRGLARDTFERESRLWEKKISSEKDYLDARTALAEAEIALRASGQKLLALGFSRQYVELLTDSKDADLTRYEVRAPIAGTVIERHVSLGEAVSAEKETFLIADPSAIWVDVTLYPRDLSLVRAGQAVSIDIGDGNPIQGKVAFVTPHISEETRTAVARVINGSVGGRMKPGMFVNASIEVGKETARVRVPKSAIQNYEDGPVIFVQDGDKFEPRPIRRGRENAQYVEVVAGIGAGETYVSKGSFVLKAELEKASFGDGHNH